MDNFYQLPLQYIHIELTSLCNASCPMCARNLNGGKTNPHLANIHLPLSIIDKIDLPTKSLTLCGNYGDPILFPELHEFIKLWLEKKNTPILIMTNGGVRSPEWWADLAKVGGKNLKVIFGIDGLSETNHIYRKGVQWERLMANANSFIKAGGAAVWKFIIFKHNAHQINTAQEMAAEMGFKTFEKILTNRFYKTDRFPVYDNNENLLYYLERYEDEEGFTAKNKSRKQSTKTSNVDCYAKRENSLYIAADGRVYPCCNTGYHYSLKGFGSQSQLEINSAQNKNKILNIKEHTLREIISGDFFDEFKHRFSVKNEFSICQKVCGLRRDNLTQKHELS